MAMRRREFTALLGSVAAAWSLPARAEPPVSVKRRIAAMINYAANNPDTHEVRQVFEQSLESFGWTVGRNLTIDYRFGIADPGTAKKAVADLIALKPDLIFANSVAATRAAKEATPDIPIVFNAVSEPVSLGFVTSLSHPGGNITGFSNLEPSVGGKWLELLKSIAPSVSHVGIMYNPASTVVARQFIAAMAAAGPSFGLITVEAPVHEVADIDAAMERLGKEPGGSLITLPDTFLGLHFRHIVELESQWMLPAIHPFRYYADAGSLMSYGPDLVDQFRRAASYINKIFRGEKAADLPVQQPTKFDFVINQKTAKMLGLSVSPELLATADKVIE
jgi:putative ABC transport system substrate-binding protein